MITSITILGCSASLGVPIVGCSCLVCTSTDPKNCRKRTGLLLEYGGRKLLIDASPDIREQCLLHSISRLDGICLTHAHFDHIGGLVDLRPMCTEGKTIPCLLSAKTYSLLKSHSYSLFSCLKSGILSFDFREITSSEKVILDFAGFPPIHCSFHQHSDQMVTSYRFGSFAFVTDVGQWNNSITELLASAEIAFIGIGGWKKGIKSQHTSIEEVLVHVEKLSHLKKIYFTHLSHLIDYNIIKGSLGSKGKLAWDGLKVEFIWNNVREL